MINFESHVNTTIDFTSGITILTGNSSQGKSGIFRALRFVLLNQSEGEDSINYDAKECSVEIIYNGHSIKRVRNRTSKNEYWLDGELFKAFGQGVPEDIMKVLNLNPINFEWQFDKRPFLLAETGGYIATKLNEIVDLKLIDSSLSKIESKRRASNKEKERLQKKEKSLEEQISEFDWLINAEKLYEESKQKEEDIIRISNQIDDYNYVVNTYDKIQNELDSIYLIDDSKIEIAEKELTMFNNRTRELNMLNNLSESYSTNLNKFNSILLIKEKEINDLIMEVQLLKSQKLYIGDLKRTYENLKNYQETYNNIGAIIQDRRLSRVENKINTFEQLKQSLKECKELYTDITKLKNVVNKVDEEIQELRDKYRDIAPDICPICGGEMNKELQ